MRIYNVFVWALTFVLYVLIAQVSHATTLNADALYLRPGSLGTCSKAGTIKTDSGASNVTKVCDGTTWRQLVRTDATEVLTNKDIDGGTAANTSRITIPKDTKANLDALNRKSGTVVYGTDTEVLYIDNGTSLIPIGAGSGSATDWGYVENGGVEIDATGWSVSGGTGARTTTAAQVLKGEGAYAWDPSAGSQTITLPSFTIPAGGLGNCEARVWVKGGGTADITFVVKTGSTSVSQPLTVSSALASWGPLSFNFVCTAGSATAYFIEGTSAGNAAEIYFDEYYGGEATNIGTAAQASEYGTATTALTAGCNWSTTSTSLAAYAADADCPTPTVTGQASAPGTKIPGVTFSSLPPGDYLVMASGYFGPNNSTTVSQQRFVISDGTTQSGQATAGVTSSGIFTSGSNIVARFSYSTAGAKTFQIFGVTTSASNAADIVNSSPTSATPFKIQVYRFPTASEQVFKVGAPGLEWTAFTPTGSWVANTTYTGRYQCDGGNLSVQYDLALSGAPTSASLTLNLPSGFTIDTAKLASGTSTNGTLLGSTTRYLDTGLNVFPGIVNYESTTSVRAKLQTVTGSNISSAADLNQASPVTWGAGDVMSVFFTVPVTADSPCPRAPMPLLKNAVTTASEGVERIARVKVQNSCTTSPCTIRNSVGVSSVTRTTTGDYTVNFSPAFSSEPTCVCTFPEGNTAYVCRGRTIESTTTWAFYTGFASNTSGGLTAADYGFNVICIGPN